MYVMFFHFIHELFILSSTQFIPMPVLYGVFLYMGVASLNGVQVLYNIKVPNCSFIVFARLLFIYNTRQKKKLILLHECKWTKLQLTQCINCCAICDITKFHVSYCSFVSNSIQISHFRQETEKPAGVVCIV